MTILVSHNVNLTKSEYFPLNQICYPKFAERTNQKKPWRQQINLLLLCTIPDTYSCTLCHVDTHAIFNTQCMIKSLGEMREVDNSKAIVKILCRLLRPVSALWSESQADLYIFANLNSTVYCWCMKQLVFCTLYIECHKPAITPHNLCTWELSKWPTMTFSPQLHPQLSSEQFLTFSVRQYTQLLARGNIIPINQGQLNPLETRKSA